MIFSRQKCSNFVPVCTNFDIKAHTNKIQCVQFQNNVHGVEKLTISLYAVKFPHLHEEPKLRIIQSSLILLQL